MYLAEDDVVDFFFFFRLCFGGVCWYGMPCVKLNSEVGCGGCWGQVGRIVFHFFSLRAHAFMFFTFYFHVGICGFTEFHTLSNQRVFSSKRHPV